MSDFVLDASATLAAYLPATPAQKAYAANVLTLIRNGAVPAVPGLWVLEVGAVLISARRRGDINQTRLEAALAEIDALPYQPHHVAYTAPSLVAAAKRYMLQGYDAVYFDLAKKLGIPIASLDKGHRAACKAHGVELLVFT